MANNPDAKSKILNAVAQIERQKSKGKQYGGELKSRPRGKKNIASHNAQKAHSMESRLCEMVDTLTALRKAMPRLQDYVDGKISADIAFSHIAPASLIKLVKIMSEGESEKNQLDAAKHLLALAGHIPAQRHEVSRVDVSTPKEALVSLILSNRKNLEAHDIEVVDDEQDKNNQE